MASGRPTAGDGGRRGTGAARTPALRRSGNGRDRPASAVRGDPRVKLGVTRLLEEPERYFGKARARVGLVANYNAVDERAVPIIKLFSKCPGIKLARIYAAEHGLWGCEQAGVKVSHGIDELTGVEVVSLYGEAVKPTPEMLDGIDVLVCDGNDIGSRYWTGIATVGLCIEAAAEAGKPVIVTDRPNPLGGTVIEGSLLDLEYRSFVGYGRIPMRHGMTAGELAAMFAARSQIDVDLTVVPVDGWVRHMLFPDTGHFWTGTPNMPSFETALVYPGTCLFEGTTVSEGRGTTKPFRLIGAPWLDPFGLADTLNEMGLNGVRFRPARFRPVFSKHSGAECAGVEVHVTNPAEVRAVLVGVSMLYAARKQNERAFRWRSGDAGGSNGRLFIDLLAGGAQLRAWLEEGASPNEIIARWEHGLREYADVREAHLMYR